jgi:hypothetical protein
VAQCIRVLSESELVPSLDELRRLLPGGFEVAVENGVQQDWSRLLLRHRDGAPVARVERELVSNESSVVQELSRGIEEARPRRAVEWLKHYLAHVKTVYSFEPLHATKVKDGVLALQMAQAYFWKRFGGILQADDEGFTNREGQHVLWQFHGPQQGELEAAVMDDRGRWVAFTIDMGDPEQVEAFRSGEVPAGAKLG